MPCGSNNAFGGGAAYPTEIAVTLGSGVGTVFLDFEAYQVPDRFIVTWNDSVVIDTGYVGAIKQQGHLNDALAAHGVFPPNGAPAYLPGDLNDIVEQDGGIDAFAFCANLTAGATTGCDLGAGVASFQKTGAYPATAFVYVYAPINLTMWNFSLLCPANSPPLPPPAPPGAPAPPPPSAWVYAGNFADPGPWPSYVRAFTVGGSAVNGVTPPGYTPNGSPGATQLNGAGYGGNSTSCQLWAAASGLDTYGLQYGFQCYGCLGCNYSAFGPPSTPCDPAVNATGCGYSNLVYKLASALSPPPPPSPMPQSPMPPMPIAGGRRLLRGPVAAAALAAAQR